ncbi:unnamed protein product [Linum tenue]|uniref:ENT domain-containing protein n=1 Tax=Linum tenue TaxID=586396 RepID=A0AAV0MFA7_9ROSI|nr:unnamed protein product [Linum tenue]
MRFKKGSKVEVLGKEEGVWRLGEITSGKGHTYSVKYDVSMFASGEDAEERVPRKAIRPYPPFVAYLDTWSVGDVVEIYVNLSWRTAVVMEVLDGNYYSVKLTGTARELQVNKINIRVPQLWQDGEWFVMGKGNSNCEDVNSTNASTLSCYQKASPRMQQSGASRKLPEGNSYIYTENNTGFQESCVVSARTLKRACPFWSSDFDAYDGSLCKKRAIGNKGQLQGVLKGYQISSLKKHGSPNNQTGCARRVESNDSADDACSVGSCSVISMGPSKLFSCAMAGKIADKDSLSSDAESHYYHGDEDEEISPHPLEDVSASIHRLELHAYRSTLEALYASGPLSWEQEELLTDLRISLNISHDEHSMEIRNLISIRSGGHSRW